MYATYLPRRNQVFILLFSPSIIFNQLTSHWIVFHCLCTLLLILIRQISTITCTHVVWTV